METSGESFFKEDGETPSLADLIRDNDAVGVQHHIRRRLEDHFSYEMSNSKETGLNEEYEPEDDFVETEQDAIDVIQNVSGDEEIEYQSGTISIDIKGKDAAEKFLEWLDEVEYVESYDVTAWFDDGSADDDFDFDDTDENTHFEIFIDLIPEIVTDTDESITESVLSELKRKLKIDFRGKKRFKMTCSKGFRWDPGRKACVAITGGERVARKLSLRKALRTKKSQGPGYQKRVIRKMKKAKRFRKSMGIKAGA